ncbi:MAG: T9SS type A sorting domain-containing protein, partial [Cyclobacteriaceae bacterium]|nr:T9SS type A sorting domain-containing protein [Cyclobacteriaceae bacterium]
VSGNDLWVLFRNPPEGPVTLSVYEMTGRLLETATTTLTWAENPFHMDTANLSPGIYLLVMNIGKVRYSFRFVKL